MVLLVTGWLNLKRAHLQKRVTASCCMRCVVTRLEGSSSC